MKKRLKAAAVMAMAGTMMLASVSTALADTAVVGGTYELTLSGAQQTCQITYSETPLNESEAGETKGVLSDPAKAAEIQNIETVRAQAAEDGYELKEVYIDINGYSGTLTQYGWEVNGDIKDAKVTPWFEQWGIWWTTSKQADFTVEVNGQDYPNCALYAGLYSKNYFDTMTMYAAVKLPKGYEGNCYLRLYDHDSNGYLTGRYLEYSFSGNGSEAVPETTASVPLWKQDAQGWRIERPDGSYMANEWYQSPDSGLWYYMGADGYMLTNATTPDGYTVNADGVWVQ